MQALFEDKLASQNEALLQGKQLADIIASTSPESTETHESSHSHASGVMSAPAIGQTGSGVIDAPRPRAGFGVAALALGLVAVAGAGGGYMWWAKQGASAGSQSAITSATQASTTRGVLAIASEPPGASITINGEKQSEVTPASISKLPIGVPILVQLEANGFEPAQRTLTLTETEPSSALSVSMSKGTLSLEVALKPVPPGASLILDGKPYSQLSIDGVTAGDSHKLVVTAPGHIPQSFTFTGAIGEKRRFDTTLVRGMVTTGARAESASPSVSAGGSGKLNVSARGGWCNVTVDGAGRGPTPVAGIQLSAGTHTVTCTPEGGRAMSAAVSVPPDGTARYSFSIPQ
jgi:serine/threonine-protein kinase